MQQVSSLVGNFDPTNILLIQLGDIGDVVLTAPTIRAVKETFPDSRVSIVVTRPYGSLLAADPNLTEVIELTKTRGSLLARLRTELSFMNQLRIKKFTLAIDLRTGDHGAILAWLSGAAARFGYRGNQEQFWHKIAFTNLLDELHPALPPIHPGADQSLRIVRELGIDTFHSEPKLFVSEADRMSAQSLLAQAGISLGSRFVTANPYSRWKYKEWSDKKWGEVLDLIWQNVGLAAVLIGSADENNACGSIVWGREKRVFNLAGKTSLGELAALISLSSLHIGVDSAAPHIAAAVDTPTVTIHGPSDWRAWRIVNETQKVVNHAMSCVPCNSKGCDNSGQSICLDDLDSMVVGNAVLELIGNCLGNEKSPTDH